MTNLPPYAATPIGRALIAELIASPPDSRLIRDDWGTRDHPHYVGKPAAMLRRLHAEYVERELATLDRMFAVTHQWDQDAAAAIIRVEGADQLIQRLLAEGAERREAA